MSAKAKRGDLVLVEYRSDVLATPRQPHTFSLERVTGVTRDGLVKRTSRVGYATEGEEDLFVRASDRFGEGWRCRRVYYLRHLLIPAAELTDAQAVWTAWLARQPEDGWQPEPFASVEEATAFVIPFRRPVG